MTTITELGQAMQGLLTTRANELARTTGFIERERKVTGAGFAQALVFGWMANPASTREEINQAAANAGMRLSTPGLDKRFNGKAVGFLDSLLAEGVQQVMSAVPQAGTILARFSGVCVADSTTVSLPSALAGVFRGTNGVDDAAVKVAAQWELSGGSLRLWLHEGRVHDQQTGAGHPPLPAGALRLNDLGFFNLTTFTEDAQGGVFFFSRYKVGTLVSTADGQALDLTRSLRRRRQPACDLDIRLGSPQLPCRLIALRLPPEQVGQRRQRLRDKAKRKQQPVSARALALAGWNLYVTNIPANQLHWQEAALLACSRWQIECRFKLWKSAGLLDESRSHDPLRVLCEFYAKLLSLLIQHWLLIVGCWWRLNRSLHRATQLLRKRAFVLLDVLSDLPALIRCLHRTAHLMAATSTLSKRRAQPLTFQRWLEVANV